MSNDLRRWMNVLCEGADERIAQIKQEIAKRGMIMAGIEPGEERNPDGLPEDEIIAILIKDAERNIDRQGGMLYVFRAISLVDLPKLRTNHLGQSWSLEEEMAMPYRGDDQRFYRLAGRVKASDIDRMESILHQVAYEEQEVVVNPGAPIAIDEIMLVTPGRMQSIDSPLIGKTLRA